MSQSLQHTPPAPPQALERPPVELRQRRAFRIPGDLGVRLRRFAGRYGTLLRDSLRSRWRTVLVIAIISFVGASAQAGAIGVLLAFVRVIENGSNTGIPWIDEHLGTNVLSLVAMVVALATLGVLSALASYAAKSRARALGREADARVARRVLELFSGSPHVDHTARRYSPADLRQLMVRCPRLCGSAIESVLHLICPVAYALAMALILVRVNASATLLIVPLFLLLLPLLHRFNSRVRQQSRDFYTDATRNQAEFVSTILRQAGASNVHREHQRRLVSGLFQDSSAIRGFHDAYDHFRLASDRSVLITSLFRPLALSFVLVVLGVQALHGEANWGEIIVYAIALSQLMTHGQTVAAQFTTLNLFYPEISKYLDFSAHHAEAASQPEPASIAWPIELRVPPGDRTSATMLPVGPGDRLVLIGEPVLSRLTVQQVVEPLQSAMRDAAARAAWAQAAFVAEAPSPLPETVAEHVLGEKSADEAARRSLLEGLERIGVKRDVNETLGGLDRVITPEAWKEAGGTCRAALRLFAAASDNRGIVLVDWRVLARAETEKIAPLLDILSDRLVVVCTSDARVAAPPGGWASAVLVAEQQRLIALGDPAWWMSSDVRARLTNTPAPTEVPNDMEMAAELM